MSSPPATSSAISHYREYLEILYESSPISADTKWPPTPSREFITLAVVQGQLSRARDRCIGHTLQGNVKQVLNDRKEISIDQIFEADKGQKKPRLVLMKGSPGIGKSTLAWELCRKYTRQYSLVVLLRLREEEVQEISNVSQLFHENRSQDMKLLVQEVLMSQGRDILFILDRFDELPETLQKRSFLLDLIKGYVLPASTVLVTSRPSATAELCTSCRPQKHIEILGFTQESVEKYASSVLSSEPEQLEKFKTYISASNNPAINSLMYVPLNAAIIVLIFQDRKSDSLLPHTLTELYTQLCLTILNRYLESVSVDKFEDLPADLYKQFLCLSKVAFEGIKSEEVIFHTVPPDLINFGFLDAVSALYGGRKVSYNFLHLTLQEFFAAYHISHLSRNGLEVFKKHGKDERWNVVWRFVAGLTKLKGYDNYITDNHVFIESREDHQITLSEFFIQCLFEAQAVDHFSSIFGTPPTIIHVAIRYFHTVLDCYAVGYCISNFHTGVSWSVVIKGEKVLTPFFCGLNTNVPSVGVIEKLCIEDCEDINFREFPLVLLHVTVLKVFLCGDYNLSEFISNMTCLKELDIGYNNFTEDGMLETLQQLLYSNVTTLNIVNTGFCKYLMHSHYDFYSALKFLICPSSGKLEKLHVGYNDDDDYSDSLASLVSAPSSLKYLSLVFQSPSGLSPHIPYLQNNTCLTTLHIWMNHVLYGTTDHDKIFLGIAEIVEHNKTIQHLVIGKVVYVEKMDSLRTLVSAISQNKTLLSIKIQCNNTSGIEVPDDMRTVKDERIYIIWYDHF